MAEAAPQPTPNPHGAADRTDTADELPAGPFGAWLHQTERAIAGLVDATVPCGPCSACCTSSQFVHIEPDERDALAHIPAELLFPAPMLPEGNVLLGYDEHGRCPMLVDGACSIYEHRPRTCRTYDCRVFAAAGLDVAADDKPDVARRARRWRFEHATTADQVAHDAVRAAARFVGGRPDVRPPGAPAPTTTQLAVAAVEIHRTFLTTDADGASRVVEPSPTEVRVALSERRHRRPRH